MYRQPQVAALFGQSIHTTLSSTTAASRMPIFQPAYCCHVRTGARNICTPKKRSRKAKRSRYHTCILRRYVHISTLLLRLITKHFFRKHKVLASSKTTTRKLFHYSVLFLRELMLTRKNLHRRARKRDGVSSPHGSGQMDAVGAASAQESHDFIEGELGTFITPRGGTPPYGYVAPECQFVLRLDGREAMQHLRANSFRLDGIAR